MLCAPGGGGCAGSGFDLTGEGSGGDAQRRRFGWTHWIAVWGEWLQRLGFVQKMVD